MTIEPIDRCCSSENKISKSKNLLQTTSLAFAFHYPSHQLGQNHGDVSPDLAFESTNSTKFKIIFDTHAVAVYPSQLDIYFFYIYIQSAFHYATQGGMQWVPRKLPIQALTSSKAI